MNKIDLSLLGDWERKEFFSRRETFRESTKERKKVLLIELMISRGYDILPLCEKFNTLPLSYILPTYKELLFESLTN